jgi:transcriptional regulator with XRE-family HTH domain
MMRVRDPEAFRRLMNGRGVSLRDLAEVTGLSRATVHKIVTGAQRVEPLDARRMAEHLSGRPLIVPELPFGETDVPVDVVELFEEAYRPTRTGR